MAGIGALLVLAALAWAAPSLAQGDPDFIYLGVGVQKVIDVPGVTRAFVDNPSFVSVKLRGRSQVLVVGRAAGKTTLHIWRRNGTRLSYRVSVTRKTLRHGP